MRSNFDRVMREQGRKATWLATATGYSSSLIAKVRKGERTATPDFQAAVATALGMPVEDLFPEPEQAAA